MIRQNGSGETGLYMVMGAGLAANSYVIGGIASGVHNANQAMDHDAQYTAHVEPLQVKFQHLQAAEAAPGNQDHHSQLQLAIGEQSLRRQIHKAEISVTPAPHFSDWAADAGHYGKNVAQVEFGLTAVALLAVGASRLASGIRRRLPAKLPQTPSV